MERFSRGEPSAHPEWVDARRGRLPACRSRELRAVARRCFRVGSVPRTRTIIDVGSATPADARYRHRVPSSRVSSRPPLSRVYRASFAPSDSGGAARGSRSRSRRSPDVAARHNIAFLQRYIFVLVNMAGIETVESLTMYALSPMDDDLSSHLSAYYDVDVRGHAILARAREGSLRGAMGQRQ